MHVLGHCLVVLSDVMVIRDLSLYDIIGRFHTFKHRLGVCTDFERLVGGDVSFPIVVSAGCCAFERTVTVAET